ncbi:hypothetical protein ACFW9N_03990 [Streptomyces sp. NPDC059496]|uniref:hypothetical protein n=1 Tax=Streptomyces sp. NPDC059496 TaxID=3346851 RepID=UPI00367D1F40
MVRPEFRRRGSTGRRLRRSLSGMKRRVDITFVSYGIEGVYEKRTHERQADWNRPIPQTTWKPGRRR